MEKHPATRPVLADDIEGIIKAGQEAREKEAKENMVQFVRLIKEALPDFPEETYSEQCQKIHMLESITDVIQADIRRILREVMYK